MSVFVGENAFKVTLNESLSFKTPFVTWVCGVKNWSIRKKLKACLKHAQLHTGKILKKILDVTNRSIILFLCGAYPLQQKISPCDYK